MTCPLARTLTVPVGTVYPDVAATTTVSSAAWLATRLTGLIARVTVGFTVLTFWITGLEVLAANPVAGTYVAVTELAPAASAVVVIVATPLVREPVPSEVVPLKNWTV